MKSLKQLAVIALAVVVVCGVVGVVILKREAKRPTAVVSVAPPVETELVQSPAPPVGPPPAVQEAPPPAPAPKPAPPPKATKDSNKARKAAAQKNQGRGKADPPPQDVLAREALSFVGMDSDATAYWVEAINDPNLPAEERKNLIEDLNEDGLPDPKYPTMEDLPLITSRIRLIEQLVPDAMDQDNLDAFAEAYKDLLNLADLARGGGEPVR